MDHSVMDHSGMSHAMDHSGHGSMGMDMGSDMDTPMCNMNMIFTWDTTDLCIVFNWWHIRTTIGLWISMIAIVALGAGYEYIRHISRKVEEQRNNGRIATVNYDTIEQPSSQEIDLATAKREKLYRAALYAFQVFYSFFLMLVFMTYNGWAMLAVTAGAFLGFYIWGEDSTRGMSCH